MSLKHDLDVNKGHKAKAMAKKIDKKITVLKVARVLIAGFMIN